MADKLTFTEAEQNQVFTIIQDQKRIYREYQQVNLQLRRMRALRLDTRTPRAFQRLVGRGVRVPLSWSLVQTINGMITKGVPAFSRVALKPTGKAEAQNLSDTCWPLIQTYSNMAKKDLYYQMCDALAGGGKAVVKLQRRPMKDYPERGVGQDGEPLGTDKNYNQLVDGWLATQLSQGKSPLHLSLVDSQTFMPDRNEVPQFVMESGRRALLPTLKALNLKFGTNNELVEAPGGPMLFEQAVPSGMGTNVMVDEVWTDEAAYFSIGGKLIKFNNDLGFIPYAWRAGMSTSIPDPVLEAVSTIFPFYGLEPHLNTLMTSMLSWAVLAGMPSMKVTTAPNAGVSQNQETPPTDVPLGQMFTLAQGKDMNYLTPPPVGREMSEVVNLMLSIYDRAGVTQAARGIIGARTPGLTFTSALEAAADMVGPVKAGLEGLLVDICQMTWKAVEKLNVPLQVTGVTLIDEKKVRSQHIIRPSQIRGYYDIHCDIQPESTQDTIQKGMHAAFMNAHQLWSKERSMTYSGVRNVEAERTELLKDQVRQSPFYLAEVEKRILSDEPDLEEAYAESQAQGIGLLTEAVDMQQFGQAGPGGTVQEGIFGDAPQPRGGPAPMAGGAPAGRPRRPTGPGHNGGSQFPK